MNREYLSKEDNSFMKGLFSKTTSPLVLANILLKKQGKNFRTDTDEYFKIVKYILNRIGSSNSKNSKINKEYKYLSNT